MAHIFDTSLTSSVAGSTPRNSLWRKVKIAFAMHRERCELACLDDHILADLGLTRQQALKEASRKFWDLTPIWR